MIDRRKADVAVFACCKKEEQYLSEWIDWYLHIGCKHIYIADNNDVGYEPEVSTVVQKYINEGTVTVYNFKGVHPIQPICYQELYTLVGDKYDWIIICDIDEFLHIPFTNDDVSMFVSLPYWDNYDSVKINWRAYDDNDLIINDGRPVQERFTRLSNTPIIKDGCRTVIKSIIRGNKQAIPYYIIDHQHDPFIENLAIKRCNVLGESVTKSSIDGNSGNYDACSGEDIYYDLKYKVAYFAHYETKSLEEYIDKINRGDTLFLKDDIDYPYHIAKFWNLNNPTEEKLQYLKNHGIISDGKPHNKL